MSCLQLAPLSVWMQEVRKSPSGLARACQILGDFSCLRGVRGTRGCWGIGVESGAEQRVGRLSSSRGFFSP